MKIFKKIETTGHLVKDTFIKSYKYEMRLATYVILTCVACMTIISYKSPWFLFGGIVLQLLVFAKYLYDRRVKLINLLEEIDKVEKV